MVLDAIYLAIQVSSTSVRECFTAGSRYDAPHPVGVGLLHAQQNQN